MIIIVAMPIAVFGALFVSARLRGPLSRPESRRPVESLVTEAIPEETEDEDEDAPAELEIRSSD